MNFKNISVIFTIIVTPIILILSLYIRLQTNTLNMQLNYDARLNSATQDAIKAYNINTSNNVADVSVAGVMIEDINASIKTFMSSLSTAFGASGQQSKDVRPYVPALLVTLYDGYYIYSPTIVSSEGEPEKYDYILKPYIYYTVRYVKGNNDVIINYTLDNYVSVYGTVNGKYETAAGYLEPLNNISETAAGYLEPLNNISGNSYKGNQVTDPEAQLYYKNAATFTTWFNDKIGNVFGGNDAKEIGDPNKTLVEFEARGNQKPLFIDQNNDPNDDRSLFNEHRLAVIRKSIENNLNAAITSYNKYTALGVDFRMPILQENEWNSILSNVSFVSFLQGLPIGMKLYNGYSYATSTTNKETIFQNMLYFIDSDKIYHKIDCPKLLGNRITQERRNYLFNKILIEPKEGTDRTWRYRETSDKDSGGIDFAPLQACYYCIVNGNYTQSMDATKYTALYNAIGKEKYNQYNKADELNNTNYKKLKT